MENWTAENYLAHHGILGMKWGHQNGPPYPLGSGDHSASERKAGWRKSLDGGSGESLSRRQRKRLKKQLYKNAKRRIDQEVDEYGRNKEEPKEDDDDRPRSKEQKAADLERAEKEGVFRKDFLDSIKDTRLFRDHSNENRIKDITKEYEKFLDDPGAYKKRKSEIDDYGRPIKKPLKKDKKISDLDTTTTGQPTSDRIRPKDAREMSIDDMAAYNRQRAIEDQYRKLTRKKDGLENAQDMVRSLAQFNNQIKNSVDSSINRNHKVNRMRLENMTDQDLQNAINRERLEIQYSELFNNQVDKVEQGKMKVRNFMESAGSVLAASATALGIALTIKQLVKK